MNNKSAYKLFLSLFLVAFVLTNCDVQDANVGTFEDAADKIPNFTVIPGAENVSVKVERNNNNAYFNVNLGNLSGDAEILDGDFLGWCAHWSAPIGTSGEVYDGVTLYSTLGDKNWNQLNYLLNHRQYFMDNVEGATYKEIQAAIWDLIEFKEFDVESNRIFENLNKEAFNKILRNVRERGSIFRFKPGMIYAVFADMSINETDGQSTQTVIIERGETAWGGETDGPGSAFWWYFDTEDGETQEVRAGSKGEVIGSVTILADNGNCTVSFDLNEFWGLQDDTETVKIQGYATEADIPSSRPPAGQFTTYKGELLDGIEISCYPFYAIHLDVWYYEEVAP